MLIVNNATKIRPTINQAVQNWVFNCLLFATLLIFLLWVGGNAYAIETGAVQHDSGLEVFAFAVSIGILAGLGGMVLCIAVADRIMLWLERHPGWVPALLHAEGDFMGDEVYHCDVEKVSEKKGDQEMNVVASEEEGVLASVDKECVLAHWILHVENIP